MIIGISLRETMEASLIPNLKRLSNIVSITCKSMQQIQDICSKFLLVLMTTNKIYQKSKGTQDFRSRSRLDKGQISKAF